MKLGILPIFLVAAIVIAIDRISKVWIVEHLDLRNLRHIEVFDPWLNLSMAWNRGVNFGLFDQGEDGRWILIGVALASVVGLLIWARKPTAWSMVLGAGLVVGGALGNVWDRVQYGAVADFINMSCCGIQNPFAFNIADAAIFLGAAVLILFPPKTALTTPRRRKGT